MTKDTHSTDLHWIDKKKPSTRQCYVSSTTVPESLEFPIDSSLGEDYSSEGTKNRPKSKDSQQPVSRNKK